MIDDFVKEITNLRCENSSLEYKLEKLNKEIKNKKEQIKELDDKLTDKEKRWDKVKQYIANIYDLDLEEDDDYEW